MASRSILNYKTMIPLKPLINIIKGSYIAITLFICYFFWVWMMPIWAVILILNQILIANYTWRLLEYKIVSLWSRYWARKTAKDIKKVLDEIFDESQD